MANPNSRATKRTLAAAAPSSAVDGTFTTTYTAQLLNDDGSYTPQATIINFRFLPDGTHHGTVHRNLAGNAPGELVFKGSYRLDYNSDLALYEGELRLTFSKNGKPTRTQVVYLMRRNDDELRFLLNRSLVYVELEAPRQPDPGGRTGPVDTFALPVPANAIVHGVMQRVT